MAFSSSQLTLGGHIKKKRIECGLTQVALAPLLQVCNDTIVLWESDKGKPQVQYYPALIEFLGYYPFSHETESIGGKLTQFRFCNGYSLAQCGTILGVDKFSVRNWEHYPYLCPLGIQKHITQLWLQIPSQLTQQYRLL